MSDVLALLEQISDDITRLAAAVSGVRGKMVQPRIVQPLARAVARAYFEGVRPELEAVQNRAGLVDEMDWVLQSILQLATAPREKQAYLGQVAEFRPYLLEATVNVMKARGASRLILSETERAILETVGRMVPSAASSYEQALRDVSQGARVSWRGTANELREVLREVIDYLAPDVNVTESAGFQLERGQTLPTQRQKVRFVLRARRSASTAIAVAESSLDTIEGAIAALARSVYQRGSVSTHLPTDSSEIRTLKRYIDALLGELLEIRV